MVNTDKIRLMAKAAAYEARQLQQDSFVKRYYKQDYVDRERLRAGFFATVFFILFWIYQAIKIFYIEAADLLTYDYVGLVIRVLVEYIILLVVVTVIASFVHIQRFDQAKKRMDNYYDLLDQIDSYQ